MSAGTYEATKRAFDALDAANRARNAPDSEFDPKFQVAKDAVDQVTAAVGDESSDAWAANQVRTCLDDMREYRDSFQARDTDNEAIAKQLSGIAGHQIKDANGVLSRNAATLDTCMVAAKSYL
jgi:hypothetical protein